MKKLAILFVLPVLNACGGGAESPSSESIANTLEYLKVNNAEVVLDAQYNEGSPFNWVIYAEDNGSNRKGLANALCNDLYETGILARDNLDASISHGIRIVDRALMMSTSGDYRSSSLGSADCKSFEMFDI